MFAQLFNGISGFGLANKQRKDSNRISINEGNFLYGESPFARENLGNAMLRKGGLMPGLGIMQNQIDQSQANTLGAVQRAAGSGSDLLAMAAAINAQSGQNAMGLGAQAAQWNQLANRDYQNALGLMINEGDKVFNSKAQYESEKLNRKNMLRDAYMANKQRSFGQIGGFMDSVANTALSFINPVAGLTKSQMSGLTGSNG